MKKNRLIGVIAAFLILSAAMVGILIKGHHDAAREVKENMSFVSGSEGVSAEELKEAREAEADEDDFITAAIGRNLKKTGDPSIVETTARSGEDPSDEKGSEDTKDTGKKDGESETVTQVKPEDKVDEETIPFDIAQPDAFESGEVEYADNQILIKFKKSFNGKVSEDLRTAGIGKLEPMFETESGNWFVGYLHKRTDVNNTLESVRGMKHVVVAEYNFKSESASIDTEVLMDEVTSNEKAYDQWALRSCGIQEAWKNLKNSGINPGGDRSVTVAVIDTGVDYTHQDLDNNIWVNSDEIPDNGIDDDGNGYVDDYYGIDMTAGSGSGMDDQGHGTHVAGIIAAENNKIGTVGIAYNTKIMPVKAGDATGYFLQSNIAKAILYAYDEGADVINMSFGGGASSVAVRDALETAYSRVVLVAAAGNNGMPNEDTDYYKERDKKVIRNYPGDYKFVMGVMSVDSNDVESGFSNWDATRFNNNEYEVYAPGNGILSTIPGNRYAALSGTSMASPVVAAQAALIRSKYSDMDTYPTKFVYGQISGTSDECISCCNPRMHTVGGHLHNIPGRVNFVRSLTEMPNPEVHFSDYTIFDTAGFSADTEGITAEAADVNNGDGIIDSGEVIALGLTLRNRWGMSKDSTVSINATNELGVTNSYVTFLNNDINYGSVGTYSEKDAGQIIENDEWTGWEKPFYLKISDKCPNNYTITLNITVTSKNGLDESDNTTYLSKASLTLVVRNGVVLPNKITEDMTLTKDNYYVIPNSTIIMEGATVTVEPGTQIQFWTNDPSDAYADTAITYLKVQGQLLCNGTEEEPISIFPSDWMGQYYVEIYKSDKGYVSMEYTNVTNPYLIIDKASNCKFDKFYPNEYFYYRYLSDGKVCNALNYSILRINDADDCVVYKMDHCTVEKGNYDRCMFVDSALSIAGTYIPNFRNCVFYGNESSADGSISGGVTSITLKKDIKVITPKAILHDADSDKYYICVDLDNHTSINAFADGLSETTFKRYESFAKFMNGSLASINSEKEFKLIKNFGGVNWIGLHIGKDHRLINYDNSIVPNSVSFEKGSLYYGYIKDDIINFADSDFSYDNYSVLEIPGNGLATDITLDKYAVNLETGSSHQIEASIKPYTCEQTDLVFKSEDESVAKVDATGKITAVSPGTTQVKVYSQDLAVYNYVTVNVTDYVAIESLDVSEKDVQINIGETKKIKPVFTPADTTRTAVTYESSAERIASVSAKGVVTANKEGEAVITVSGENGLKATVTVHCVIPVESVAFSKDVYETNIDGTEDSIVTEPEILPADATNKNLVWESTDESICKVADGKLVKGGTGIATLRVTVENTELSDEITVIVTDNEVSDIKIKNVKYDGNYTYAITEAGEIYVWGNDLKNPVKMAYEDVDDAYLMTNNVVYILDKTGNVTKYTWSITDPVKDESFGVLKNIDSLSASNYMFDTYHAIDKEGNVWAWGNNNYGQLGDGSKTNRDTPVQIEFSNTIVKSLDLNNVTSVFLDKNGVAYVAGTDSQYKTPEVLFSSTADIYSKGNNQYFSIVASDSVRTAYAWNVSSVTSYSIDKPEKEIIHYPYWMCYIQDGIPYVQGSNSSGQLGIGSVSFDVYEYTQMVGIKGAKELIPFSNNRTFIITEAGNLYACGYNANYDLGTGNSETMSTPVPVEFLTQDYSEDKLDMTGWSGSSGTVTSDGSVKITFDQAPAAADDYSLITLKDSEGEAVAISKSIDLNKLTIKAKTELTDGATYTLTIPQTGLRTRLNGEMTEALTLAFEYKKSAQESVSSGTEADISTDDEDVEDDEVVHEVVRDEEKLAQRSTVTAETLQTAWEEYCGLNINANFYSNVILNRINDDDTSGWLRITAPDSESYETINLGHNYWGTTNENLINKQILDFDDYQSLADIDHSQYLTEAPTDTFPFVTEAYLTVNGGKVDTVGNEEVTFVVKFNRAMDTSIDLDVKFGSAYPYADYTVDGEYVSDTEWQGTVKLTTLIENGYQYFSISNGKAKGTSLKLYKDWGRFPFQIDTSSAQSLLMQGNATKEGIELSWTQDDFETLAGYNVYRSTKEDGLYTKVNTTVIPADTKELLDDTVEPGVKYYYNFTVVQSDMTESEPSGKVEVTALDTMAPNIYHTPVTNAFKGSNLVISATIIDNVEIRKATLYYRVTGSEEWKSRTMDRNNDKYSAVINSSFITDDGLEYYIEAFDGQEYTYNGSADKPFAITVQEAITASDLGDVDGNGVVELKDALMLLMAVNDRLNLTEDEFRRADLDENGELSAKEALKIINYINGTISSLR